MQADDSCSLKSGVGPHPQWHILAYATKIEVNQLHAGCSASLTGLWGARRNGSYIYIHIYIVCSVSVCAPGSSNIDLVFVLDDSGSICDADSNFVYGRDSTCGNWGFIKQFVYNIVNGMNIGPSNTMVGLVRFDSTATVGWKLDAYVPCLLFKLFPSCHVMLGSQGFPADKSLGKRV